MSAPYCRAPNELPDLRLWLRDEWKRPPFVQGTLAREGDPYKAQRAVMWELRQIDEASLWWVSGDMVELLLAAVPSVPDEVLVDELPIPATSGLVVFERPWIGQDTNDPNNHVQVDMMLWGPVHLRDLPGRVGEELRCLGVSTYRRLVFEDGMSATELQMATERDAFRHAQRKQVGHFDGTRSVQIDDDETRAKAEAAGAVVSIKPDVQPGERAFTLSGAVWLPLGRSDWPTVDPLGSSPWDMEPYKVESFVEDRRIVAALVTLVGQEGIAERIEHVAPRQVRRRGERAGLPPSTSSNVQVVTLRRSHERAEQVDGQGVQHDHRWLVTGHWRNQPFGPGRSQRRLQWIRPHVKGPAGAPLVVKERVNAWVR